MARARPPAATRVALVAVCGVVFLTFLDNTIVSAALADMQTSLRSGVTGLQWIVDGYMLAFAGLMLSGGTLGDLLGRKRMLLIGVAIFCAGSLIAALAPDAGTLIAGRVVMGVGAAASEPGTLSLIRQLYPERRQRTRALGVWTAVSGVSLAVGPVLGGIMVGLAGWRGIFWFNVAFGVAAFAAASWSLPESADRAGRSLDLPGLIAGAGAVSVLTYAIIEGESAGFSSGLIVALFAVAALACVAFAAIERRARDPVLPLGLLRDRTFSCASLVAFTTSFGMFAVFFFSALYLQVVAHFSGWQIALQFVPMAFAMVVAGTIAGAVLARRGPRLVMAAGCLCAGAGMLAVRSLLDPHAQRLPLAGALALVGFGLGLTLVAVTAGVLAAVPAERSGLAASTVNTARQLGGVLAVAILGAVVNGRLVSELNRELTSLGVPPLLHAFAISKVTRGGLPANAAAAEAADPLLAPFIPPVLNAAVKAFGDGVHATLLLAGVTMLVGAALSLATDGRAVRPAEAA